MTTENEAYFTIALFLSAVFVFVSLAYISRGVKLGKGIPKMRNPPPPPPAIKRNDMDYINSHGEIVVDERLINMFKNSMHIETATTTTYSLTLRYEDWKLFRAYDMFLYKFTDEELENAKNNVDRFIGERNGIKCFIRNNVI